MSPPLQVWLLMIPANKLTDAPRKTVLEHDRFAPGGYGEEMGEMYAYALEFGYWGKEDETVVFAKDVSFLP